MASNASLTCLLAPALLASCMASDPAPPCIDCAEPDEPMMIAGTGTPAVIDDRGEASLEEECLAPEIGTTRARLLTRFEYDNTVRDLLGDKTRPARNFPAENRILAFDNDGRTHVVSPLLVEQYQGAAEQIARTAVAENLSGLLPCTPGSMACARQFIDEFLRRAFRGGVSEDEAALYRGLLKPGFEAGGFNTAIEMVIEAVLQSPRFLYRIESATPGDTPATARPIEIASRLSYFIWASMPDDQLLISAESGRLANVTEVERQARRMLADPRARESMAHFFISWLDLETLSTISKDLNAFPEYRDSMRSSWLWSIERYVDYAVFERGTMDALLTEPIIFVDSVLEPLYAGDDQRSQRAGLLTQPALMARLSHPNQSSPIRRGVFVRERILCEPLPSPPNNVDTTPPDPNPNGTTRERFAEHTSNAACSGCHSLIDPMGFGFEKYDGLGRFREFENGIPIDATGAVVATKDDSIEGPFDGALELSQRLAGSSEVRSCLVTQLFRYAMGRAEQNEDSCTLRRMENRLVATEGRIDDLLVAITLTEAFRMKREGDAP